MRRRLPLGVAALLCLAPAGGAVGQERTVLIRNGRVLDGTGNPWIAADVLIRGDRIEAVGRLGDVPADEVIDAGGLYVAPGFIDMHSHAAPGLASPGLSHGEPLLAMGLTTIFANPDGGGPVDLAAQRDALRRDGLGVNVAQLVGHGSVRSAVVGPRETTVPKLWLQVKGVDAALETKLKEIALQIDGSELRACL